MNSGLLLLRARAVLPMSRPAIEDGAVLVANGKVASVGRRADLLRDFTGSAIDLGDSVLLPGLINGHCHLDYTKLAGQMAPPRSFTDWLKLMITGKSGLLYSDFAESWLQGARMLVESGTTTVADIEIAPEMLPEVWPSAPLRVISLLEMTGVRSRRPAEEILAETLVKMDALPLGRNRAGLSPHAPYSTAPELLRLAGEESRRRNIRVATHVAESAQEFEMYSHGSGEMYDWLARNGRDMSDCGLGSPVEHLERNGALNENLMAIHVNYLGPRDAKLLSGRGVGVVHCPRSHTYFRHDPFPFRKLQDAGVNICLGTDSLASVLKHKGEEVELNMFDELREFQNAQPGVSSEQILRMATVNGARVLGMAGMIGEISPEAAADLIALPFSGAVQDVCDAVVAHRGPVTACMIEGEWAVEPASR